MCNKNYITYRGGSYHTYPVLPSSTVRRFAVRDSICIYFYIYPSIMIFIPRLLINYSFIYFYRYVYTYLSYIPIKGGPKTGLVQPHKKVMGKAQRRRATRKSHHESATSRPATNDRVLEATEPPAAPPHIDRRTWTSPDARCVMAAGNEGTAVFSANG